MPIEKYSLFRETLKFAFINSHLTILISFLECGIRPAISEIPGSRIVGGHESEEGAWPWQVSLQTYNHGGGFLHLCGGTLINNRTVLSAAHCYTLFSPRNPEMWRAVIGLHHLFRHKTYTIKRRVKAIDIHFFYNSARYEEDIAMFHLSKSITFNNYVQPACLPNVTLALTSDMKCFISGWGMKKEKGNLTLQEAQLKIFSLDTCNQYDWHAGTIPDTAFCAGSETGDVDTCQGDSGGPLVCYLSDSKYYVVGITSYGIGCGRPKFPGVYTNLPKYMFWVRRQLSEANTVSIQQVLFLLVVWNVFQLIV
uniref:Peptidase S1 domain-containing protein n=1 Tax=Pseudonaja textilis TaxID=8673 RepID=A0A670ZTA4_PSETE